MKILSKALLILLALSVPMAHSDQIEQSVIPNMILGDQNCNPIDGVSESSRELTAAMKARDLGAGEYCLIRPNGTIIISGGLPPVVDPDPVEPPDPVDPDPIEPPDPVDSAGLLVSEAATMQPGEWRDLSDKTTWPGKDEGRTFKQFQYVSIADGMGWTQPLGYHDGKLLWLLHRSDGGDEAMALMDDQGNFTRIEYPRGYLENDFKSGGRRPFHRLMAVNGYLVFAPKVTRLEVGSFIRTPLDNPGVWEKWGPAFEDDQVVTNGAIAVIWSEMWQRFYAYTAGSKIWSRTWDDEQWTRHTDLQADSNGIKLSGYAGFLFENPIKQEILILGGQEFGSVPPLSFMSYKLTDPLGAPQLQADLRYPDGEHLILQHGGTKVLVHPEDGSYLIHSLVDGRPHEWLRTITGGGTTHPFDDFSNLLPWGGYESYAVIAQLPGTDVFVYVSHIKGLGLYRPKSVAGLPSEPESDPINQADDYVAPPAISASFSEIVNAVPEGGALEFKFDFPEEFTSHEDFWTKGGHHANKDYYGPVGFYDSARQKFIYIKDRTPGGSTHNNILVLSYDLANNTMQRGDVSAIHDDPLFGSAHTYGMQAYDRKRGHAYYKSTNTIRRYLVDEDRFEQIPTTMPADMPIDKIAPAEWHEGLDMLVRPQAQKNNMAHLGGWKEDGLGWRDLGSLGDHDPYHATMHYNRTRGDMLLVGGSGTDADYRRVTLIDANGGIHRKADIPLDPVTNRPIFNTRLGQDMVSLFHDPISGNYLYKTQTQIWEYRPEPDEWRFSIEVLAPENKYMYPGNYFGWVMVPMEDTGTIAILNYYRDQVYRHKSVFSETLP